MREQSGDEDESGRGERRPSNDLALPGVGAGVFVPCG